MTIMKSCCCWDSVRRGSFACAVYTLFYYSLLAISLASQLEEEREYLLSNVSFPSSTSLVGDSGRILTAIRYIDSAMLVCASSGILCSLLLIYALIKDRKLLLIPWISILISICALDVAHWGYLFLCTPEIITIIIFPVPLDAMQFVMRPPAAMVFSIHIFLLSLNIYAALCVLSQYQEYAAGRGTAADAEDAEAAVRYIVNPNPDVVSCLSSKRNQIQSLPQQPQQQHQQSQNNNSEVSSKDKVLSNNPSSDLSDNAPVTQLDLTGQVANTVASINVNKKHVQFPDAESTSESFENTVSSERDETGKKSTTRS